MFAIIVLLFAAVILAAVVGAMAFLDQERARRERNDPRYRFFRRNIR